MNLEQACIIRFVPRANMAVFVGCATPLLGNGADRPDCLVLNYLPFTGIFLQLSPLYRDLYAVMSPLQVSVCNYLPFTGICMHLSPLYWYLYAVISPVQVPVCNCLPFTDVCMQLSPLYRYLYARCAS